jgi:hypothetical protein
MPVLAHGGRPDELVAEFAILFALVVGWVGVARLRGRGFGWMPRWAGWSLAGAGVGLAVLGILVPTVIWRAPAAPTADRPSSTAELEILTPVEGQQVSGSFLDLVTQISGATVVDADVTEVTPDTGHVHVYVDDQLMSMAYAPTQRIPVDWLERGPHIVRVEFVAADHAPFDPPVEASVTFVKMTA